MTKQVTTLGKPVSSVLTEYGIVHGVVACDPQFADTIQFCEQYGYKLDQAANTIIVEGKSSPQRFAACIILATTRLDVNKKVCQLLEVKRASFARMDDAVRITHMEFGGITAIGLPATMTLYIDGAVMKHSSVIMGGGNRSSKLSLDPRELLKLPNAQVIEGLAHKK